MEAQTSAVEANPKPKPGGWVYLLPIAIFVLATGFAIYLLVAGIQRRSDVIDNFARFDTGSTATVELKAKGTYTIWVELPSSDSSSGLVRRPDTSALVFDPQGDQVVVKRADEAIDTYSDGNREATAVHEFRAAKPGEYRIGAVYNDGGEARFAVGRDNPDGEAAKGVGLFFLVGAIGFFVSLIVLIVIMIMRGRSKRRIRAARLAQGGPYPGGGYGTPPYGGAYGAQPSYGAPTYGAPSYGAPSYGAATPGPPPAYGEPSYGGPTPGPPPAYGEPSYGAPTPGPPPSYGEPPPGSSGGAPPPDPHDITQVFGGDPSGATQRPFPEEAPPPPPGWTDTPPGSS